MRGKTKKGSGSTRSMTMPLATIGSKRTPNGRGLTAALAHVYVLFADDAWDVGAESSVVGKWTGEHARRLLPNRWSDSTRFW